MLLGSCFLFAISCYSVCLHVLCTVGALYLLDVHSGVFNHDVFQQCMAIQIVQMFIPIIARFLLASTRNAPAYLVVSHVISGYFCISYQLQQSNSNDPYKCFFYYCISHLTCSILSSSPTTTHTVTYIQLKEPIIHCPKHSLAC